MVATRTSEAGDRIPSPEEGAKAAALRIGNLMRTDITAARDELDRLENQNPWFFRMVQKELESWAWKNAA